MVHEPNKGCNLKTSHYSEEENKAKAVIALGLSVFLP